MRRTLVVLAVGALLSGCPGSIDRPERFLVPGGDGGVDGGLKCLDIEKDLFVPTCGGAGCHENPGAAGTLDLVSAGVADRIKTGMGTCAAKPMTTFILEKVKPTPSCGAVMPLGSDMLSAETLTCLETYLNKLADGGS